MAWEDNFIENRVLDFDGYDVPLHTQGELTRYFLFGLPPGHFCTSMLEGRHLNYCVGVADPMNQEYIMETYRWIESYLPDYAKGLNVQTYLLSFREKR